MQLRKIFWSAAGISLMLGLAPVRVVRADFAPIPSHQRAQSAPRFIGSPDERPQAFTEFLEANLGERVYLDLSFAEGEVPMEYRGNGNPFFDVDIAPNNPDRGYYTFFIEGVGGEDANWREFTNFNERGRLSGWFLVRERKVINPDWISIDIVYLHD
jgi:hypothetical protein